MRFLVFALATMFLIDLAPLTGANEPSDEIQKGSPAALARGDEDPEVAAYIKTKGWSLNNDVRISDLKRLKYLVIEDRAKPFDDVVLTADDYKMIARSKTVQVLDLRKVKVTDEGLTLVVGIPQLEGIVIKGDEVTDAGLKALSGSKSLDNVALIETKKVTAGGLKALAALPKLQSLTLMFFTVDGSAFEAFAGSKTLASVTLYVDGLTDDGARHLAKLPNLNQLDIRMGEGKLTAAGIKAIVDVRLPAKFEFNKKLMDDALLEALLAKGWLYGPTEPGTRPRKPATPEEVKEISLSGSRVTDKGIAAILNCTNTTSISLDETSIADESLRKIASFKKLRSLFLSKTKVTAVGLEAVAGLPISFLTMDGCEMTEEMFKALGKMTTLETLYLSNAKLKPEWLKHISALPKLKELNLLSASLDDAAAKDLAKLPNLQSLTCNYTQLGDAGFQDLLKLPKLRQINLDGTKVTKDAYLKAKKEHPKVLIINYGLNNQ